MCTASGAGVDGRAADAAGDSTGPYLRGYVSL